MRVPRRAAVFVAAAAAGVALSACSSMQMGAAAITGNSRITTATLTNEVANLNAAYQADRAKQITPQRPVGQAPQQVLTWLITFRIYDQLAAQQHIYVTQAQVAKQMSTLTATARQNGVTVRQYVSAAGGLPPDLLPQLSRYFAILQVLERRITGGKAPATQAEQTKLQTSVEHAQCLASKSLRLNVNPQYGQFDYATYSVVPAVSKLAANSRPASPPAVKLSPPC
ncbi:MAG: SurA N-terminal domain-containing protein [Actinobacteria bacterium]|nr:SurA N-terminal domain-containing protein [Actinomycetota bacterium]MBO0837211.1 SurA N-terminal domain-containing protein [Actinomycetota bacterium]